MLDHFQVNSPSLPVHANTKWCTGVRRTNGEHKLFLKVCLAVLLFIAPQICYEPQKIKHPQQKLWEECTCKVQPLYGYLGAGSVNVLLYFIVIIL